MDRYIYRKIIKSVKQRYNQGRSLEEDLTMGMGIHQGGSDKVEPCSAVGS